MARAEFGGGAGTFGLLSAMMGAGTVAGAIVSAGHPRLTTNRMLVGSSVAFGLLTIASGAAPTLTTELVALAAMGAAGVAFSSCVNARLQLYVEGAMRGRVMALYAVVFLGSTPIGGPLSGWVADQLGVRAAFHMGGIATLVAAGAVAWWLLRRRRELREEEPDEALARAA